MEGVQLHLGYLWRLGAIAHGPAHRALEPALDEPVELFVKATGDGFLATFDGPARAIRCACALRDAASDLHLDVRVGLHTGEIEVRGDDIGGVAVHIGQRVSALAQPSEIMVSSTVKDLVAGSGIEFEDRGEHELKGVPGSWRLFAARA
jgi:class 3 adenylate cyclase